MWGEVLEPGTVAPPVYTLGPDKRMHATRCCSHLQQSVPRRPPAVAAYSWRLELELI